MSGGGGGGQPGSSGGQSQTEETAIHTPLREMGFDANLISEGNFQKKRLDFYCNIIPFLLHFSSKNFESEWQRSLCSSYQPMCNLDDRSPKSPTLHFWIFQWLEFESNKVTQ